jgi:hypothetical protein
VSWTARIAPEIVPNESIRPDHNENEDGPGTLSDLPRSGGPCGHRVDFPNSLPRVFALNPSGLSCEFVGCPNGDVIDGIIDATNF